MGFLPTLFITAAPPVLFCALSIAKQATNCHFIFLSRAPQAQIRLRMCNNRAISLCNTRLISRPATLVQFDLTTTQINIPLFSFLILTKTNSVSLTKTREKFSLYSIVYNQSNDLSQSHAVAAETPQVPPSKILSIYSTTDTILFIKRLLASHNVYKYQIILSWRVFWTKRFSFISWTTKLSQKNCLFYS